MPFLHYNRKLRKQVPHQTTSTTDIDRMLPNILYVHSSLISITDIFLFAAFIFSDTHNRHPKPCTTLTPCLATKASSQGVERSNTEPLRSPVVIVYCCGDSSVNDYLRNKDHIDPVRGKRPQIVKSKPSYSIKISCNRSLIRLFKLLHVPRGS